MSKIKSDSIAVQYFYVFLCAAALYLASCAPGCLWQDSGVIQYRVWHNDIEGTLGLALAHPLFYVLAIITKLVPFGELAYKVNLVSALAGAVAVANLFLLIRLWFGKELCAVLAAVMFALSHTFWRHASIAETYPLYIAFFLAELTALLQYTKTDRVGYLYVLALLNGLAFSVHMLASIPFVCYVVLVIILLVKKKLTAGQLGFAVLAWAVGAGLYLYLILKNIYITDDIAGTLASAAFGQRWQAAVLNTSISAKILKENILFFILNFPTPNILLLFFGLFALKRVSMNRAFNITIAAITILFLGFAFRYTIVDRYAFFIPFYCMVAIFIAAGAKSLDRLKAAKVLYLIIFGLALLPVPVYVLAPRLAKSFNVNIGTKRTIPYRDKYTYFLQPWRAGYNGAERFAAEALENVENGAVIYADSTTVCPLLYVQEVHARRPDVKIISPIATSAGAPDYSEQSFKLFSPDTPVYVVQPTKGYCPSFLLERYDFLEKNMLWRVIEKSEQSS